MRSRRRQGMVVLLAATAVLATSTSAAAGADASGGRGRVRAASTPAAPVRLIVHFRGGTAAAASPTSAEAAVAEAGQQAGQPVTEVRTLATGGHVLKATRPLDDGERQALLASFARRSDVATVELDVRRHATAAPNDPKYPRQWHYFERRAGIDLPAGLAAATRDGAGVTVAVLDTGITSHPDLRANVVPGYDFISDRATANDGNGRDADPSDPGDWSDPDECGPGDLGGPSSWHGTHVAGTIAAVTGNGIGGAGIAPRAAIEPVRVLGTCGGWDSDIADAIVWASGGTVPGVPTNPRPAQVVNLSLGGPGSCGRTMQDAIDEAVSRGTTVVVAAGNDWASAANYSPASCARTITVAALDRSGNRAWYSNYGSRIDLAAPGGELDAGSADGVLSTLNSGATRPGAATYDSYMGTSMAAPHVAGVAALVRAERVLEPADVEAYLEKYSDPIPGKCLLGCGAGLLSAGRAVRAVNAYATGTDVRIPDGGTATTHVTVRKPGRGSRHLQVTVRVRHRNRGQLGVALIAPDGTAYRLKNPDRRDARDDIASTYVRDVSAETAAGVWQLRVTDSTKGTAGYLDGFRLQF